MIHSESGKNMTSIEPYTQFIVPALLFVDGLFFGLAVKKGMKSLTFFIAGIVLASYLGLSFISFSPLELTNQAFKIATELYDRVGPFIASFPILFILGVAIGIWRG